jgi:hypothetical protein
MREVNSEASSFQGIESQCSVGDSDGKFVVEEEFEVGL